MGQYLRKGVILCTEWWPGGPGVSAGDKIKESATRWARIGPPSMLASRSGRIRLAVHVMTPSQVFNQAAKVVCIPFLAWIDECQAETDNGLTADVLL